MDFYRPFGVVHFNYMPDWPERCSVEHFEMLAQIIDRTEAAHAEAARG